MKTSTVTYPSHDGSSIVHALLWEPDLVAKPDFSPRAVVQLVHGMSEHVERYEAFAEALCGAGFVVCANDHIGHGMTASGEEDLGHMPIGSGEEVLLADVHTLRERVCADYPTAPYVLFGHSMGSFVARVYLTRRSEGVSAAIICGTGQQPHAQSLAGKALTRVIAALRGERYKSALVDSMGAGAYSKAIKGARTNVDWISIDPEVVDEYVADPHCGQVFTVGAYNTLAHLVEDATDPGLARKLPRDLPMLFVAGAEDPVGECGRGVHAAVSEYRNAGVHQVEEIVYPGARHEILNEPAVKDQVVEDILAFLERQGI